VTPTTATAQPATTNATHATGTALFDLSGHRAVVTGASRGIGAEAARALDAAGAQVVLVARSTGQLKELASTLRNSPVVLACDLTGDGAIGALVNDARSAVGMVDILVNNAAVHVPGAATELPMDTWDLINALNVRSAFELSRALAPGMAEQGWGKVINMASVLAMVGDPLGSAYVTTKSALLGLTRALGTEWASRGIRVNALCPGWVETEMTQPLQADPSFNRRIARRVPLGRWGTCADLAGALIFLASHASDFMTGQAVVVDGGLTTSW
jgi:NAD(P)-dependent dehydrogenase (short-subunit alcohol dehydrogenase family)